MALVGASLVENLPPKSRRHLGKVIYMALREVSGIKLGIIWKSTRSPLLILLVTELGIDLFAH